MAQGHLLQLLPGHNWCKSACLYVLRLRTSATPLQEVEIMKSLTFDNNVCQFYGTCPKGGKTLLLLEFLEVRLC